MKPHFSLLPLALSLLSFFLSSCTDDKDDAPYPNIVTELADCPTDAEGRLTSIVRDDDTRLTVSNPLTDLKPSVTYRALVSYTEDTPSQVTLYSATSAAQLHDSTAVGMTDPTGVVSLWRTRRYLNLHLLPKTQNQGTHAWGFITDSIRGRHAYLRLHHRQGQDPTAYSTDVYASLQLQDIAADTLTLTIQTFTGTRTWDF